ncbi:MAG: transposase, partial [Planctomycetaceae bacterium]|nr:transposase [Planctomycetaceae bacterium]
MCEIDWSGGLGGLFYFFEKILKGIDMSSEWVEEELGALDLGDERLNNRLATVLEHFSAHPNLAIPAA